MLVFKTEKSLPIFINLVDRDIGCWQVVDERWGTILISCNTYRENEKISSDTRVPHGAAVYVKELESEDGAICTNFYQDSPLIVLLYYKVHILAFLEK